MDGMNVSAGTALHESDLEIGGLTCASCVARVERALKRAWFRAGLHGKANWCCQGG